MTDSLPLDDFDFGPMSRTAPSVWWPSFSARRIELRQLIDGEWRVTAALFPPGAERGDLPANARAIHFEPDIAPAFEAVCAGATEGPLVEEFDMWMGRWVTLCQRRGLNLIGAGPPASPE